MAPNGRTDANLTDIYGEVARQLASDMGAGSPSSHAVAWERVARSAVLALLETALDGAARPTTPAGWSAACRHGLDRVAFSEDSGVSGITVDRAIRRTAEILCAVPGLEARMPLVIRGRQLTIATSPEGVRFSTTAADRRRHVSKRERGSTSQEETAI